MSAYFVQIVDSISLVYLPLGIETSCILRMTSVGGKLGYGRHGHNADRWGMGRRDTIDGVEHLRSVKG